MGLENDEVGYDSRTERIIKPDYFPIRKVICIIKTIIFCYFRVVLGEKNVLHLHRVSFQIQATQSTSIAQ